MKTGPLSLDDPGAPTPEQGPPSRRQRIFGYATVTIPGVLLACVLLALATGIPDARAACDSATFDSAMDNCATLYTSVTDNTIFYSDSGPAPTITFNDNTCTSPPCALADTASALHGIVSNTGDGTFTYTFNDNSYSGIETITYTKNDGTPGTIDMVVCAVDPCTISNPTAQIGTYVFDNNALIYTPDVTKFGIPATDNLSYVVTDKTGHQSTVELTYVYPSFNTSGVTVTYSNGGPSDQTFRHVEQGTVYYRYATWSRWGRHGRQGGASNSLVMNNALDIATVGNSLPGIEARSVGGTGEGGGNESYLFYGEGGDGGWGGSGGDVIVNSSGNISTDGTGSHGIWAQSRGGDGGYGGNGYGIYGEGGIGGPGGPGRNVTVYNFGNIVTLGEYSDGIRAESLSGLGGKGGNGGGWFSTGGKGAFGVPAGNVLVDSTGDITTAGVLSHGIFAQSIGGGGGTGGDSSSWFWGDGGDGGGAGDAGTVEVRSVGSIETAGTGSDAIFAQSVGGGGGGGGNGSGWFVLGGSGAAAGDGNLVDVTSTGGSITTGGDYSNGIFAQSVGGSGGGGGSATAVGAFFSIGVGGNGGDGGDGKTVTVRNESDIHTGGENSNGILAQSVGGGGGSGGYSIAGSVGIGVSGSLSIGGSGAKGGDGGVVSVTNSGIIGTDNAASHGIFAQSVGGTGGSGGFAIAGSVSTGASLNLSFGGSGGSGGTSGAVTVADTGGSILTLGDGSYGILAQSVGGGGGNGGFSIAGGISAGGSLNFSMAGGGGAGNRSSTVSVTSDSNIATVGEDSHAIFAQSVGGGGGSGGFSIAGGIGAGGSINASVGGAGGSGANADNVTVSATGTTITTSGDRSYGILAQSVGGGGGDGGFSVSGNIGGPSLGLSFGGSGGTGAAGGSVRVDSDSSISTLGRDSHALFAQSVGGGGGSGGFSVSGSIGGAGANLSFGGDGGGGGIAGPVLVDSHGAFIHTEGERSYGILAQSIGGSGGDGGFSVSGSISYGPGFNLAMGGDGGGGGFGGAVSVADSSDVFTDNNSSHAIFAQSVGGGGGSGGFSVTGGISANGATIGASIGGGGGDGATAGSVSITTQDNTTIRTLGNRSYGILAQSMGGSGGDGGFSVAGGISNSASVNFSMGGGGGAGGAAGAVSVLSGSNIGTFDNNSHALFAQSVGGGGGSGGFSVTGGISAQSAAIGASIGGSGGNGASAGSVSVTTLDNTTIHTSGERSYGILAQSIGGTGGDGGFSVAGGISKSASVNFSMGGGGGDGGRAGSVTVDSSSDIETTGDESHAIFAQSVGGGGGSGGFSVTGGISAQSAAIGASIGGSGGDAALADNVSVTSTGSLIGTSGDRAYGILAQSVGGTGGDGGFSVAGSISKSSAISFSMGGGGGEGGVAGAVSVASASDIGTLGEEAHGIFAQSVGGGGGSGGFSVAGSISWDNAAASVAASIGGSGGDGALAGRVDVTSTGSLVATAGDRSYGILAQSVGGTGGDGGFSVAGSISKSRGITFSMGGSGGAGGIGSDVDLDSSSSVYTLGDDSHGLFAQSVGGGGGTGGFSVAGSISADNSAVAAVSASIGGSGGSGGTAGAVALDSTGSLIETYGGRSYGILAQSVGGTGGDGGFSVAGNISRGRGISFSMGGSGGTGGDGGAVILTSASDVVTHDNNSHAIFAQSVGGGGGSGGFSVAGSVSSDNNAFSAIAASIGGFGGAGGNADNVTVTSTGAQAVTYGTRSYGILAQSVGGGGGDGGFSVAGGIAKGGGATFSLGGSGDGGGDGRVVHLSSETSVATYGEESHAIFAQSVGGGGGSGGFSIAGSIAWDNAASTVGISVGGFGGSGGDGGSVTVDSTGPRIVTASDNAYGILAQSIGGGGGNGGFSVAGSFGLDNNSKNVSVSVGGFGGDGGSGGAVGVTSSSAITTLGIGSSGIFAQSVGGRGGTGGFGFSGTWGGHGSKNISLTLGGFGGEGNQAGDVEVRNSGEIDTSGYQSHGIFAQSVGGGGGKGGWSAAVALGSAGDNTTKNVNLGIAVGGFGGDGGYGGAVEVQNEAFILTRGIDSQGIFAQSIGGGGGEGGSAFSGAIATGGTDNGAVVNVSTAVGGFGGDGNHGGAVTVGNTGDITTLGNSSNAIFAQSVGGGGGNGGKANSLSLVLDKSCGLPVVCKAPDSDKNNWSFAIAVGGFAGGASDGGVVTVTNSGNLVTQGGDSSGIFAQSIGGGGGTAGNGTLGLDNVLPVDLSGFETGAAVFSHVKYLKNWQAIVGGSAGSSGNGDNVVVVNSGDITILGESRTYMDGDTVVTENEGAYGIFAQSVGAGGGVGGNATTGATGKIGIGGGAGSAGNGGDVTVENSGRIDTIGGGGHAILAQSVGGGGGIAGDVKRTQIPLLDINTGANLAFGRGGGNSGDGGDVVVENSGEITTQGKNAFGIFAQSVGGGGGIAGNAGLLGIPAGDIYDWFAGSVGGDGSGGDVTVTHSGSIVTLDNASHGIFAQSAGGNGFGGTVTVTLTGDVVTLGDNAVGVFAQSRGDLGGGDITVDVGSVTVLGGFGTGAGVWFLEGDNNALTNRGTITTVAGAAGTAIAGSTGDETIDNFGTVTGSVDLGAGANSFRNRTGANFNPGGTVNLGDSNLLLNEGVLSPGGVDTLQHTLITGDFQQAGTGTYLADLDHRSGQSDRLTPNGISELSGLVSLHLMNPGYIPPGTMHFPVLSGMDNVTNSGLVLDTAPSAVVSYGLEFKPTEVEVVTNVSYSPGGLTGNSGAIGRAVNEIQLAGGTDEFAPVAAMLVGLPGMPELESAYDQMSPDPYDSFTQVTQEVTRLYTRTLLKRIHSVRLAAAAKDDHRDHAGRKPVRLAYWGGDPGLRHMLPRTGEPTPSRNGLWFDVFGQSGDQDTVGDSIGYDYHAAGAAVGFDSLFGERFLAGFAIGSSYTYVNLAEGKGDGNVKALSGAVYGSYFTPRRYLDVALSAGTESYDQDRIVLAGGLGGAASSSHDGTVYTGYVEGGENFLLSKGILQPYASLQYILLDEDGFTESGAGPLSLVVDGRKVDSLRSELGLRLYKIFQAENMAIIPEVGLAWNYDFGIDDSQVTASFASAPFASFSVNGQQTERNGAIVGAGVTFQTRIGFSTTLRYRGEFRDNYSANEILGEMLRYEF